MKCIYSLFVLTLVLPSFGFAGASVVMSPDDIDDSCDDCFVESQEKIVKSVSKKSGGFGSSTGVMGGIGMMAKGNMSSFSKENSSASQLSDVALAIVEKMPKSIMAPEEKQAFKGYLELLGEKKYAGNTVGGSNAGLNAYFDSQWGRQGIPDSNAPPTSRDKIPQINQCFRDKALNFYRDVALRLKSVQRKTPDKLWGKDDNRCDNFYNIHENASSAIDYGCPGNRSGLFSTVGDKYSKGLEPGWLWKLALKHSKGNAYAAMHLIGMCGHDDTSQSRFRFYDDSETAKAEIFEELQKLKEKKTQLEKQVKEAAKNISLDPDDFNNLSGLFSITLDEVRYLERQKGIERRLSCPPRDSAFYAPGGLSIEADISSELKNKIARIQNPDDKLNIPAKHYHVYGSAFMACNLVTNGFDPQKAVTVQKQAARMYRGTRMCESSNDLLEQSKKFEKTIGKSAKRNYKSPESFILDNLKSVDIESDGFFKTPKCRGKTVETLKNCEMVMSMFGDAAIAMKQDSNFAKRKVMNRLARIDAAQLYNSWYVGGGKILGQKIPCTDIRYGGPKNLMDANNSVSFLGAKPEGWSKERYDAATKHLATWDVDFEWTIAQHEAGAKFAAKNCKKSKPGENPFKDLCAASDGTTENTPATLQKGVR